MNLAVTEQHDASKTVAGDIRNCLIKYSEKGSAAVSCWFAAFDYSDFKGGQKGQFLFQCFKCLIPGGSSVSQIHAGTVVDN